MSDDTHETAATQFIQVGEVRLAYRRFGRRGGIPLLFLNYFAANVDDWGNVVQCVRLLAGQSRPARADDQCPLVGVT
jgi:pimeloyl-ACP methyl ester carboxylesterase